MASRAVNRDRYRQYARFLRNSADRLNAEITPGGLDQLLSQVNAERNKFMIWEITWLLVAIIAAGPVVMIAAVQFEVALPEPIATRAHIFHLQVVTIENMVAWSATLISIGVFVVAAVVAFSPIILHGDAVKDLEQANKVLKMRRKA